MKLFTILIAFLFPFLVIIQIVLSKNIDDNKSNTYTEVIRIVEPGVFDYQSSEFLIRMGLWGIEFPKKDQPGYMSAINFCEEKLLNSVVDIRVKKEFNQKNIKLVEVYLGNSSESLNLMCIRQGLGWHNEDETSRFGPYVLAQMRAKRSRLGVWGSGFDYGKKKPKLYRTGSTRDHG